MMPKPKPKPKPRLPHTDYMSIPAPPPVLFLDALKPDEHDWNFARAYLLTHARWEAIESKRSMRAGDKVKAAEQWDTSQRLFRLAQAMQTIAPLPDMQEKDEHPNKKVLPEQTPMR